MNNELVNYPPQQDYGVLPVGTTDDHLIEMWLVDTADNTKQAYRLDIQQFRDFVQCPLQHLKLPVLQAFKGDLEDLGLAPNTRARKLKAVKSLLSFAKKTGYTQFNVGAMVKIPKSKNTLAERILTEEQVISMIVQEHNQRNHVLLRLLYAAGLRVSELCDLCWKDVHPRGEAGQITIFGKGEKTRHVLLKESTYKELLKLRNDASNDDPVFRSRGGGRGKAGSKLDPSQAHRIVEAAAVRAGIETYQTTKRRKEIVVPVTRSYVSPHWLRHAHASHALDNGASIALVKETLGHESIETTSKYTHAHPDDSSARFLKI